MENNTNNSDVLKILGILNVLTLLTGIIGMIGMIILYIVKQDTLSEKERYAIIQNFNFQLSFTLYFFISAILTFVLIGFLGLIVFGIAYIIGMIIGAIKYFQGETYDYFWTIKFIK